MPEYSPKHFKLPDDKVLPKDEAKGILPYVFTDAMAIAIDVALATNRPLLVSGNPGCGKSRLADALAELQSWSNLSCTITSRTRLESLTAEVDQLRRLNDAQTGRLGKPKDPADTDAGRPDAYYLNPGIFWWAFDADSARRRGLSAAEARSHAVQLRHPGIARKPRRGQPAGAVLLIDEIDKAEPDLPNDLLEPLDRRRFDLPEGFRADRKGAALTSIEAPVHEDYPLLTLITTNGERDLPQAFLRRCVLLEIPDPSREALIEIALRHEPAGNRERIGAIADILLKLRDLADKQRVRPPGTAELLDAVRACEKLDIPVSDALDSVWSQLERAVLAKDPALRLRQP
jgi:MoxR-like ATPase